MRVLTGPYNLTSPIGYIVPSFEGRHKQVTVQQEIPMKGILRELYLALEQNVCALPIRGYVDPRSPGSPSH